MCGMLKQIRFRIQLALIFVLSSFCISHALQAPHVLSADSGLSLLPDVGGTINAAVISVNSARKAALRNADLVTNIVNGLPESVRIYILTNDPGAFTVAQNPWPERIRFINLPYDNPITIWTQDPFLVLQDSSRATTLLAAKDFDRAGDQAMTRKIAESLGYQVESSNLIFEGGNIVSDNDFVFVGANTIRLNAIELNISEVETVKLFESELGRKVLVIGPVPQPVAHIDMILTPIGNKQVVLADAHQGIEIAEAALENDPKSVQAFERFCEDYFFGSPQIREIIGKEGKILSAPVVQGKTRQMVEVSRQIAPVLDGIAEALTRYGYRVYRVPFLAGGPETLPDIRSEQMPQASYPMLTYNNVLIEANHDEKVVYLPRYQWQAMDDEAGKAWKNIGFAVLFVKGLTISSMYGGSLRCSVKVLEREGTRSKVQ